MTAPAWNSKILITLGVALLATIAEARRSQPLWDLAPEALTARRANLQTDITALSTEARRADWLGNAQAAYEKLRVVEWLVSADVQLATEQARRASPADVERCKAEVTRVMGLLVEVRRSADRLRPAEERVAKK